MNQSAFAAALLDPDLAVPAGLIDPEGRRFAVYRNNVAVGLIRALETGFPVVRRLVGSEFFSAMARIFAQTYPPKSRIMMLYGSEFPVFLSNFQPVAHLVYLPDVARLEQALRESYHSADAAAVSGEVLSGLPEDRLLASRFGLAPSLRLVRSTHPIHAIWRNNAEDGPAPVARAEDVVVLRTEFDPKPHLLGEGAAAFLFTLGADLSLAKALHEAGEGFDLLAVLNLLLSAGAIVRITG